MRHAYDRTNAGPSHPPSRGGTISRRAKARAGRECETMSASKVLFSKCRLGAFAFRLMCSGY